MSQDSGGYPNKELEKLSQGFFESLDRSKAKSNEKLECAMLTAELLVINSIMAAMKATDSEGEKLNVQLGLIDGFKSAVMSGITLFEKESSA